MIRRILGGLLLAATPGIAAAGEVAPADHAARDLYLRFERAGYVGAVYLNADDTYVIVQTGPQDRTESFSGRWSANGPTGVCIHPDGGSPGQVPARLAVVRRRLVQRHIGPARDLSAVIAAEAASQASGDPFRTQINVGCWGFRPRREARKSCSEDIRWRQSPARSAPVVFPVCRCCPTRSALGPERDGGAEASPLSRDLLASSPLSPWMSVQTLIGGQPRHAHCHAYAAVVLSGRLEQAGEAGRRGLGPGDVVVHAIRSPHRHKLDARVEVLNLPLPPAYVGSVGWGQVAGLDDIIRLARTDLASAARELVAAFTPEGAGLQEPPDRLAARLRAEPLLRIGDWAGEEGIARETAFRWFRQTYGVAPSRYRVEARARSAWKHILGTRESLAGLAAALGFADQAHMTRDVVALTGVTPARWRAQLQHSFKTRRASAS